MEEARPKILPTRVERQVLEWVGAYVTRTGRSPNLREIAAAHGCSVQWAHNRVRRLRDLGLLYPGTPGRMRQIVPTGMTVEP